MMLTHEDDAKCVILVLDQYGDPYGTYPNKERAIKYITDWIRAGGMENKISIKECSVTVEGTAIEYTLVETTYRD